MKRFKVTKENFDSDLCREILTSYNEEDIILNIEYDSHFVEISDFSIRFKKSFLNPEEQAPPSKINDEDYYFKGEDEFTKLVWIDEKYNEIWETKFKITNPSFKIVSIEKPFNVMWIEIYIERNLLGH